jgi:hypothetical protein
MPYHTAILCLNTLTAYNWARFNVTWKNICSLKWVTKHFKEAKISSALCTVSKTYWYHIILKYLVSMLWLPIMGQDASNTCTRVPCTSSICLPYIYGKIRCVPVVWHPGYSKDLQRLAIKSSVTLYLLANSFSIRNQFSTLWMIFSYSNLLEGTNRRRKIGV